MYAVIAWAGSASMACAVFDTEAEAVRLALKEQGVSPLMLETDSPYLSPQSVRSVENEPSHLPEIAQKAPYVVDLEEGKTYYWCACGRSATQPFCDGSHRAAGFTAE